MALRSYLRHRAAATITVFPARQKIPANIVVHFLFICIPTPATVRIYRNVDKRIELKSLKTFVPSARLSLADISVPEVKYIPVEASNLGSHGFIKGFGPGHISILLALVHVMAIH